MIIDGSINKLERPLKLELTYKLLLALRDQVTKLAIVHRDLKPENILVQITPKIVVNIIDYGLAKEKGVKDQSLAGTVSYMPPEAFRSKKQNTPCDVFSMAKVITLLWVNDFSLYDVQDLKQGYRYGFNSARWVRNYRKKNQDSECNILKLLEKMLCPHPNNNR